ncbi:actin subfamily protein [Acanthamoeba castellanii str. Neff]|uniref:Actin subfamily protein n=1 Tax=Acanthamoeba castellanii (strain ATCC 30010 / Neff) TaxID=1257118 RepID=L8HFA3_ACACF|nr:actin subfamily protein [Acanthamoeba castellanii str. Neff]ELR23081.1 actin subfamily protein [Acanthamoeba castellanii str. Neff]
MRASRALYRLGRMNPVWQHFATNAAASSSSLATEKKSWNADWYGLCRRMVADGRRKAQVPRNRHIEGGNESFGFEHHCKGVELAHRWQTRSGPMLPSALTVGDVNAGIRPPAIVIDSGTLNTKVGFGGEEKPRATFPTIVGRQRHCHSFTPKVYTGDVALQRGGHLTCRFPPMDHPVLNLEPIAQSRASREKATQIMLETFNVPAYCSVAQPVAALMANGLKTGLVVDVGENIIDVAPVYQGHCLQYAAQRLEIARGHGLTGVLRALLNENREPNQRLRTTSESQKVRQAKEALCFTSLNFEDDMRIADMQQNTVRDPLFGNIVFAGGSSAMPGFGQRLQHEGRSAAGDVQGGAAFASLAAFDDAWLTSQQYDEYGPPQIDWVCY